MPHRLKIQNVGKSYDGKPVLGPIDLSLQAGTITAIIGRSGCGKTTLLRCLGGLETPDTGNVKIGDGNVSSRDVGYVFQEPRLMPWLSVRKNVGFGLVGWTAQKRDMAVDEALQIVGLSAAGYLLPKQLSGGMAQRVALARALAPRPALILLDEPFSALDPFTREQMQDHLLYLHRHYGTTMVVITHDMDEALALAHRVIVLHGPPGIVVGSFLMDLPHPADRGAPAFFSWKNRLHGLVSNQKRKPEPEGLIEARDNLLQDDYYDNTKVAGGKNVADLHVKAKQL